MLAKASKLLSHHRLHVFATSCTLVVLNWSMTKWIEDTPWINARAPRLMNFPRVCLCAIAREIKFSSQFSSYEKSSLCWLKQMQVCVIWICRTSWFRIEIFIGLILFANVRCKQVFLQFILNFFRYYDIKKFIDLMDFEHDQIWTKTPLKIQESKKQK